MLELQDYKEFSISHWYPLFKDVSLETVIIQLRENALKNFQFQERQLDENIAEETPLDEDIRNQINSAFNQLGQGLFVKNNWHAPMDAKMFSVGNILKAEDCDDIRLYMTTSTVIQQDFATCRGVPFCLALRKWINIHPASEFRCIVINNILRGITPRDWPTFYHHYKEEGSQIIDIISDFFMNSVKDKFPRTNYCFDIILTYHEEPTLVDFQPLTKKTNLYAFAWKEIQPLMTKTVPINMPPVFRYIENDIGIMGKPEALSKFSQ